MQKFEPKLARTVHMLGMDKNDQINLFFIGGGRCHTELAKLTIIGKR